jgi:hypothetical protein
MVLCVYLSRVRALVDRRYLYLSLSCIGAVVNPFLLRQMSVAFLRPLTAPKLTVFWIVPSGGVCKYPFPLSAVPCADLLVSVFVKYGNPDSVSVWILFILPPVGMRFVDNNVSLIVPDEIPVLYFLFAPCVVFIKWSHGKEQMYMGISVALVVDAPVCAHSLIHK